MYKHAIIVVALLVSFSSVAQAGLVGVGEFLYDIDPVTSVASNPRETDEFLHAVAFANGTLYGVGGDRLYTVNVATGGLHLLGQLQGLVGLATDLAWDPTTDTLFGITRIPGTTGTTLVSLDLHTFTVTEIGAVLHTNALDFDETGTLFALGGSQDQFFTLDKTNAEILSNVPVSQFVIDPVSMAFDNDGTLFVGFTIDSATVIHTLDPITGVFETLGPTNAPLGLISFTYVPEPGSLLLLASGGLVLLRRKRRMSS